MHRTAIPWHQRALHLCLMRLVESFKWRKQKTLPWGTSMQSRWFRNRNH